MENQHIKKNPEFLANVLELTEGMEVIEALHHSHQQFHQLDIAQLKRIGLKTYAKDKWTIHQIIQHLIDWERIWCFRAILFAREEGSTPEAHDQEIMGKNANANERSIEQLIEEIKVVRQSSLLMFESFNERMMEMNCEFFEYEMPLSAIGLTIAAHQIHHFNVIQERYVPLDSELK